MRLKGYEICVPYFVIYVFAQISSRVSLCFDQLCVVVRGFLIMDSLYIITTSFVSYIRDVGKCLEDVYVSGQSGVYKICKPKLY